MKKYGHSCLVPLVASLLMLACNKVSYVNPSTVPTGKTVEKTGHYFLFGLAGKARIQGHRLCDGQVAKVQSRFAFGDLVLQGLTLGLYSPRTYELTCGAKGGAQ